MSGDHAIRSMTVEGALLGAPLSIQLLEDLFYLLVVTALTGSLFYLGVNAYLILVIALGGLVFRVLKYYREYGRHDTSVPVLRATPQAFYVSSDRPMVVRCVTRHWSGITLTLVPGNTLVANRRPQKNEITLWRARWSRDDYRRLSVLINWQLRGGA